MRNRDDIDDDIALVKHSDNTIDVWSAKERLANDTIDLLAKLDYVELELRVMLTPYEDWQ